MELSFAVLAIVGMIVTVALSLALAELQSQVTDLKRELLDLSGDISVMRTGSGSLASRLRFARDQQGI